MNLFKTVYAIDKAKNIDWCVINGFKPCFLPSFLLLLLWSVLTSYVVLNRRIVIDAPAQWCYKISMANKSEQIIRSQGHKIEMHKTTKLISNMAFAARHTVRTKINLKIFSRMMTMIFVTSSSFSRSFCFRRTQSNTGERYTFTWAMNCKSCNFDA